MDTIESALSALRAGKLVLVVDDFDRENEGDFIGAANSATRESVALMLRHTSGVICTPVTRQRAEELELPLMVPQNEDPYRTAFTVTVDYRHGTSTGISASDRAATIRALADSTATTRDFTRPGHVFPLLYRDGGVLVRGGHTEAGIDLTRLAGLGDVSYLCEVCDHATGEMSRLPELETLRDSLGLPLISIADLQRYRARREVLVTHAGAQVLLHTRPAPAPFVPGHSLALPAHTPAGSSSGSGSSGTSSAAATATATEPAADTVLVREEQHTISSRFNDNSYRLHLICRQQEAAASSSAASEAGSGSGSGSGSGQRRHSQPSTTAGGLTATTPLHSYPRVYVHFDAAAGSSSDSDADAVVEKMREHMIAMAAGHATVCMLVRVAGNPWDNVKGKQSSQLATLPPDGAVSATTSAAHSSSSSSSGSSSSPPSAYDALYPPPAGAPAAAAASGYGLHAVCDRVCAEVAQIVNAAVYVAATGVAAADKPHELVFRPMYDAAAVDSGKTEAELASLAGYGHTQAHGPGHAHTTHAAAAKHAVALLCAHGSSAPGPAAAAAAAAAAPGHAAASQPVPRLWEYGCPVVLHPLTV